MTDSRDGQTYRTVTLFGAQTWMAENLNYAYTDVPFYYFDNFGSDSSSWCHSNDIAKCGKYGRLYTWSAAMDSVGTWSANGKGCGFHTKCTPIYPVRGICPEGWHLPDSTEWATLLTTVGGQSIAGKKLKSRTGWFNSGNGTDNFDFSALPASIRGGIGGYGLEGNYTYFWSSTEDDNTHANSLGLRLDKDDADLGVYSKHDGLSVRCLKD
jgi:uncharacterized protein (TIGR02145 family)